MEQSAAKRRKELIAAARKLDANTIKDIFVSEKDPDVKQGIVAVEKKTGGWGACHNESALHAAIRALPSKEEERTPEKMCAWMECLTFLLEHGANPNDFYEDRNWKGSGCKTTAFQMILDRGAMKDPKLLRLFLNAGANPNIPERSSISTMRSDGYTSTTVLHNAVQRAAPIESIFELIKAGANINAQKVIRIDNEYGYNRNTVETALHIAVEQGNVAVASLLLLMGADVNAPQSYLEEETLNVTSPTSNPRDAGYEPSVRMIPVKRTALHIAIEKRNVELVKLLALHGADQSIMHVFDETKTTVEKFLEQTIQGDVVEGKDDEEVSIGAEKHANDKAKESAEVSSHNDGIDLTQDGLTQVTNINEELRNALQTNGWSTDVHKYYPQQFKDAVNTFLLAAKRQGTNFHDDLTNRLFEYAAELKGNTDKKV